MFEPLFVNSNPILEILMAGGLGAFLGLRREIDAQASQKSKSFMGLRTMTLLCLAGAISTIFPNISNLPLIFFGAIILLVGIAYAHGSFAMGRNGITTEISALIVFWIGVLAGSGQHVMAVLLTVTLGGLNALRDHLHYFARTLDHKEWFGALQLLAISGAILPFLPREPIDPWGVFVPFHVWLLIILISGVGFLGYFFIKYLGAKGGVPLTSFLGSIVSSTAVTISMASQSKNSKVYNILSGGILIALGTMQLRVVAEVYFLGGKEFLGMLPIPIAMALTSVLVSFYFFREPPQKSWGSRFSDKSETMRIESPFELGPALKFGVVFVLVLFALTLGQRYLGEAGVYSAAFLSGVIDVDAIVLSSLESAKLGELSVRTAENAILIALFVNTIIKIGYVALLGTRELVGRVAVSTLIVSLVGGVVLIFV